MNNKKLRLSVERDSVCMGDDIDAPHEVKITVNEDSSVAETISIIMKKRYLANISGGLATWIVETVKPLAVVAEQWDIPQFLVDPESPIREYLDLDNQPTITFKYWCQVNPELVLSCLKTGNPLPDKYSNHTK